MIIIGADPPEFQQMVLVDTATGEVQEKRLRHREEAERFYRRHDLLELLARLNPDIAELTQAIEREAENRPEAQRLMTDPGVGALTHWPSCL